jgi:hypothetical protein
MANERIILRLVDIWSSFNKHIPTPFNPDYIMIPIDASMTLICRRHSFRFSLLLLTANRTLAPIFPYVPPFPMVRDVSPRGHDVAYGYKNLAVLLQYQGVANLDGLTAALKLPIGFQAWGPSGVRDDRNNYDVSLSNYNKQIGPNNAR